MVINPQVVDAGLSQFADKDILSLNEKIEFKLKCDKEKQLIRFFLDGEVVRTCSYNDFIRLCEIITQHQSFSLNRLNQDVTDLELTTAYHFLTSLDNSVRNYDREDDGAGTTVSRGLWKANMEQALSTQDFMIMDSGFEERAAEGLLSAPFLEANEADPLRTGPVLNEYEVLVNFITNRKKSRNEKQLYSGERGEAVHFGKSIVRIPETHKSGQVEKPSIWKLQFSENPEKHFTLTDIREEDESAFYDGIKQQASEVNRAIVFVHGYNVTFRDALFKTAQLKFDLGFAGPMILFSWPSKGSKFKYTHDITNAEYSSGKLSRALEKISALGINEVFLIGHSMGTRCLTMALKDLAGRKVVSTPMESLVLAAPDIDKKHFEENIVEAISPLIKSGVIYASDTDKALMASKVVNGYNRLGDVDENIPVFEVIDTVDASGKGEDFLRHSYITEDNRVIDDLYHFLFNKTPPDKRRLRNFRNLKDKIYWKFA